jgi:uncharacterized protein YecT (DUF1311 family)
MSNKMSNIYVILIIIAVIIYTFFLKEQVYESFFKGRNSIIKRAQNAVLKKHDYDCQSYINRYPDLQRAFGKSCRNRTTKIKARDHYLKYGIKEKRNPRKPPAPAPARPAPAPARPAAAAPAIQRVPIGERCKRHTNKTNRKIVEANKEIEKARYRMEAAFRSCNRIL